MWTAVQIALGLTGILLMLGGDRLSMPIMSYGGVALMGMASMAIGLEAVVTRHIVVGSRYARSTYTGIAAIAQGIQFNVLGCFLLGVAVFAYLGVDSGRDIFLRFVRRPGLPILVFGLFCLLQAVIGISGSREDREGERWIVIMNLLVSRLLPGSILVLIGLGAVGLGLFEIVAPDAFDEMGGGFLEMLYGIGN